MLYNFPTILISLILFSSQLVQGQITKKDCNKVTQQVIGNLESNSVNQPLAYFADPSTTTKNELEKIISGIDATDGQFKVKVITNITENYFIDKCIYKNNIGKVCLIVKFYYNRNSEDIEIEKIQVKDQSYFKSIKRKNSSQKFKLIGSPPPLNNAND